jgi:hypothetical protein
MRCSPSRPRWRHTVQEVSEFTRFCHWRVTKIGLY